jgi:mono/diheme cytochrome c family protein
VISLKYPLWITASLGLLAATQTAKAADPVDAKFVRTYFATHCVRCHGEKKQSGHLRLDTLAFNFADQTIGEQWGEVLTQVNGGEMPPKKEQSRPSAVENAGVVEWIATELKKGETARIAARGPVSHFRLSRNEYGNIVHDLLGVHLNVDQPGLFNEDTRWRGFENIGSVLTLSPSHIEKYFNAAETVAVTAVPENPKPPTITVIDPNRLASSFGGNKQRILERGGKSRYVYSPGQGRPIYLNLPPGIAAKVRIQLSGLPSADGKAPRLLVEPYIDRDIVAPEDQPITLEFVSTALDLSFRQLGESRLDPKNPQPFAADGSPREPILLIDRIEIETPFLTKEQADRQAELVPKDGESLDDVRKTLHRFTERAWRRPVTDAEISDYVKLIESEKKAGESFRSAYRAALTAILASRNFIFIQEGSAKERRERINDWELASRLSFFLWGSMPDDELSTAARAGELRKPEVLRKQFARLLADPKSGRFTKAFPRQWLQLQNVGMFPPDKKLYPEYDRHLEASMIQETTDFFAEVFRGNLPIREFLTSDWTMMNRRLATHYGMSAEGQDFVRVKLRPEDHRGGLLTQAAILTLTSDGTRHRPINRGVWIAEVMLAATIPPPPPNVEPLNLTRPDAGKSTLRMQLDAHATTASCLACHSKIDPLGFAFEAYDAIGRWRAVDRPSNFSEPVGKVKEPQFPVNASGVLTDGRKFDGAEEFKRLMVEDLDRFAETLVKNLATFALRRAMTFDDEAEIKKIAAASRSDQYRLRTVLANLVTSDLFQKR